MIKKNMLIKGLYKVVTINHSKNDISANIWVDATHEIFKGHFPGNPIMPGVCMLQIIKEITEDILNKKLLLQNASNIKFMAKINPEEHPELLLNISYTEENGVVKLKSNTYFENTLALKLNANYK